MPNGKNEVPSKGNTRGKRPSLRLQILKLAMEIHTLFKGNLLTANKRRIGSTLWYEELSILRVPSHAKQVPSLPLAESLHFPTLSQDLIPLEPSEANCIPNTCTNFEPMALRCEDQNHKRKKFKTASYTHVRKVSLCNIFLSLLP